MAPVKPKTLGVVAALVALPTAAAVVPGPLAGAVAAKGAPTTAARSSGAASAFQAAFSTWKAASANAPAVTVLSDGTVRKPTADHTNELMFKALQGRTIAVTYTWSWGSGQTENDVVFNTRVAWFIAPG